MDLPRLGLLTSQALRHIKQSPLMVLPDTSLLEAKTQLSSGHLHHINIHRYTIQLEDAFGNIDKNHIESTHTIRLSITTPI